MEEGNKLIAEFMGYKIQNIDIPYGEKETDTINKNVYMGMFPGDIFNIWNKKEDFFKVIEALKYHSSWDWLMTVISKIWSMDEYIKFIDNTSHQFENKIEIDGNINHTYPKVVEFIKWYNKNK